MLFNCMQAYSNLDEEVGYCQGLGFVTGLLLFQVSNSMAKLALVNVGNFCS
jgi:TBC1 domain family protein 1